MSYISINDSKIPKAIACKLQSRTVMHYVNKISIFLNKQLRAIHLAISNFTFLY